MTIPRPSRWSRVAVAAGLLLALAGCVASLPDTAATRLPPVARNQARIWFYRDMAPYDTTATPFVRLNGAAVGTSEPGGAFYRDVPAGHYHVTVDSYGKDFGQSPDVDLWPGQMIYAKIVSSEYWIQGGGFGNTTGYRRDTFYVWLYPREAAAPAIAHSWFYGGGTLTAALPGR